MGHADEGLAEDFAEIARQLQAKTTPEQTQERITRAAVGMVGGCDHASISIVRRRGRVQTVAPTDDVGSDERWPAFSRRAAEETGVRSMLSFRLFVQGDTIGALNLYSRRPAAFDLH